MRTCSPCYGQSVQCAPVLRERDVRGQTARFCLVAELDDGLVLPCAGEEDSGDKGPSVSGVECTRETGQGHG